MSVQHKVCNICKISKKLEENYYKDKGYFMRTCKLCFNNKRNPNKKCFTCKKIKSRLCFNDNKITCQECHNLKKTKEYILKKKQERQIVLERYRSKNKIKEAQKISRKQKAVKLYNSRKKYYIKNKSKINENSRRRWNSDECFRLRKIVSAHVRNYILASKNGSISNYLPYSIEELKKHLESQFEPWMNWKNWGKYKKDEKTWQIDHIIPQSKLPYNNMEHPNFKKCWALNNLRPLEAKQNLLKSNKVEK